MQAEFFDNVLELLLKIMSVFFFLDSDYRKNIKGFNASYVFQTRDGKIDASAVFANNKMERYRHSVSDATVTVTFKDSEALKSFFFDRDRDIIRAVLDNSVTYDGNLFYLGKFAYMAKNLQLRFGI